MRTKPWPRNRLKASRPTHTTGKERWKITCATSTPRVRISSASASTRAAGAWPLLISSISTLLPVQEPRPLGIASTRPARSEEHTSELQSLMRISYAVFCLKKKKHKNKNTQTEQPIQQTTPEN